MNATPFFTYAQPEAQATQTPSRGSRGISTLPVGTAIVSAPAPLVVTHGASPGIDDTPLVLARIDPQSWDATAQMDLQHLSWTGLLTTDNSPMLSFKTQFGSNLVRVYADASDPQTWSLLERAHRAGRLRTGVVLNDDCGLSGTFPFVLTDAARGMHAFVDLHARLGPRFAAASQALLQDLRQAAAPRPLGPEMPPIQRVYDCVLCHEVPLLCVDLREQATPGAAGPLAPN